MASYNSKHFKEEMIGNDAVALDPPCDFYGLISSPTWLEKNAKWVAVGITIMTIILSVLILLNR